MLKVKTVVMTGSPRTSKRSLVDEQRDAKRTKKIDSETVRASSGGRSQLTKSERRTVWGTSKKW
ncbi:hypothetical protein LX36DRAFT_76128 [Colletotrichum falcatum]|nr:hypothetical protein LX36DRAFT_76128 [Colletotrichum falcatum]